MEYYSVIKKNETLPFASTWMELEIIILSEVSQTEKDKYYISLLCEILKRIQMNLFRKHKQNHRQRKQIYGLLKAKGGEG